MSTLAECWCQVLILGLSRQALVLFCGVGLKANQKVIAYFHDVHATIVPVGLCLANPVKIGPHGFTTGRE